MKQHKISLLTAILLNINIMIGSGILAGPGIMAGIAGNASFLPWPIVALLFLPLVLSIVSLSGMCPGAGGFYAYAKMGLNERAGYLSGLLYVIGYTFAVAVEVLVFRKILIGALGNNALFDNSLLFNLTFVIICVLFNLLSLKAISNILNSITIAKLIPLITLIVLLPFFFTFNFSISHAELNAVPFALPMAIFGYFGFEYCCSISHLIENPEKNAPKAILLGFLVTALIYALFHFGLLQLMGAENLAKLQAPAFAQFINLPVPYLKELLMFLIPTASVLTIFAGTNGMLNANATMMQAMAHEKLFKGGNILTAENKFGRPWIAVVFQGLLVLLITTIMPDITLVWNICNLGIFLSFMLPLLSLIVVQRARQKHYRIAVSALALIVVAGMAIYSWFNFGATTYERIINAVPFLVALTIGLLLENKARR
jgi:amino acid transporter